MHGLSNRSVVVIFVVLSQGCGSCGKDGEDPIVTTGTAPVKSAPIPSTSASPLGMAFIPPGKLVAGTPRDRVPRIAEEEMPGVEIDMTGYYIDLYPYPNETGAIPTSNVTQSDADAMCVAKGKRLCTELEWERACKGPSNTPYEYGDAYNAKTCGTGATVEEAARRPTGDHVTCKSGFGVLEMHGGPWEWTSSPWGRGMTGDLSTLRGGNSLAGELVGRCANAIGRTPSQKSPTMGFRCCKGEKNASEVKLTITTGRTLQQQGKPETKRIAVLAHKTASLNLPDMGGRFLITSSWDWRPSPNEALTITSGCVDYQKGKPIGCGLLVSRLDKEKDVLLGAVPADVGITDFAINGDAKHIRLRGIDTRGRLYTRDIKYVYGKVEITDAKIK